MIEIVGRMPLSPDVARIVAYLRQRAKAIGGRAGAELRRLADEVEAGLHRTVEPQHYPGSRHRTRYPDSSLVAR